MAWETRSIYEIAVFFLSATQLISDHGTEELWGIQSIFRGEFHSILLGQYNNQIIIRQHCKRILEYFLYCLREDFGQSALDELYYADMHDNEHNVLAYSMTMRVRSISLLESFYSKKTGRWLGKRVDVFKFSCHYVRRQQPSAEIYKFVRYFWSLGCTGFAFSAVSMSLYAATTSNCTM